MDYSTLSNEQLQGQMNELEGKYQKMRTLALKIAKGFEVSVEDIFWYEEEEDNDK